MDTQLYQYPELDIKQLWIKYWKYIWQTNRMANMIEVVKNGRMVLIGRDGEEPKPYSPKFGLTTTADGLLRITSDSDGTQFTEAFTQWTVDGKAYPELSTQAAVAAAIDKAARR